MLGGSDRAGELPSEGHMMRGSSGEVCGGSGMVTAAAAAAVAGFGIRSGPDVSPGSQRTYLDRV